MERIKVWDDSITHRESQNATVRGRLWTNSSRARIPHSYTLRKMAVSGQTVLAHWQVYGLLAIFEEENKQVHSTEKLTFLLHFFIILPVFSNQKKYDIKGPAFHKIRLPTCLFWMEKPAAGELRREASKDRTISEKVPQLKGHNIH